MDDPFVVRDGAACIAVVSSSRNNVEGRDFTIPCGNQPRTVGTSAIILPLGYSVPFF